MDTYTLYTLTEPVKKGLKATFTESLLSYICWFEMLLKPHYLFMLLCTLETLAPA